MMFSNFCQISQLSHNIIEKFWKSGHIGKICFDNLRAEEGEDFYVGLVMIMLLKTLFKPTALSRVLQC